MSGANLRAGEISRCRSRWGFYECAQSEGHGGTHATEGGFTQWMDGADIDVPIDAPAPPGEQDPAAAVRYWHEQGQVAHQRGDADRRAVCSAMVVAKVPALLADMERVRTLARAALRVDSDEVQAMIDALREIAGAAR